MQYWDLTNVIICSFWVKFSCTRVINLAPGSIRTIRIWLALLSQTDSQDSSQAHASCKKIKKQTNRQTNINKNNKHFLATGFFARENNKGPLLNLLWIAKLTSTFLQVWSQPNLALFISSQRRCKQGLQNGLTSRSKFSTCVHVPAIRFGQGFRENIATKYIPLLSSQVWPSP